MVARGWWASSPCIDKPKSPGDPPPGDHKGPPGHSSSHSSLQVSMSFSSSATSKSICRIWNITIYRLVVISETIQGTVYRQSRERENLHDGIWIIVPAPTVVSGQVLLDRNPGALHRGHDTPIQLQTRV